MGNLFSPYLSRTFPASPESPPSLVLETAPGEPSQTQAGWGRGREEATLLGRYSGLNLLQLPDTCPWAARPSSSLLFSKFFTLCPKLSLLPIWPVKAYSVFPAQAKPHLLQEISPPLVLVDLSGLHSYSTGPGNPAWSLRHRRFGGRQVWAHSLAPLQTEGPGAG